MSNEIGNYLKKIRKDKKVSAKTIGDKLGYSQSHISGIENGSKIIPTKNFISKYLKVITDSNFAEINYYLNEINDFTDGKLNLATYIDNSTSLLNAFVNDYETDTSRINTFNMEKANGDSMKEFHNYPINDIKFHLTDTNNPKYFNKVILDAEDREHIHRHIENYIELKYISYGKQLQNLYNKKKITEETYNQEKYQIDRILKSIKGDQYGQL